MSGCAVTMRRVASIPSSTGMRMSISTTSGRNRRASETASSPSPASPTMSVSGSASRILRRPTRTRAWSSAIRTRRHRIGSRTRTANPPLGCRPASRLAAVECHALAHADEPVTAARDWRRVAGAVVGDLELERVRAVANVDARARLTCVLERVRQRLLHDPVGRQLDPDRQLASLAFDLELDRKAGFSELRRRAPGRRRGRAGA